MGKLSLEKLGEKQTVSRKEAALQQIEMAIRLFDSRDFACSITLALAAEQQLPDVEQPYLMKQLRGAAPNEANLFNSVRNWLKHHSPPDEMDLFEFEVVVALARATTKFDAVYHETTPQIEAFTQWMRHKGYRSKE